MNRQADAVAVLLAMLAATLVALVAPWPAVALLAIAALVAMPRGRWAFGGFAASTLLVNAVILQLVGDGFARGLIGGLGLVAIVACNLTIVERVGAARLVDALRLPPRVTTFLAAILLAAQDVGRDFARLREARQLEGAWPKGRFARAREAARLLPALFVLAERRAKARRDALLIAGHPTRAWFVPLVAVSALAVAGRLAFLALPNVALTYVVVFLGGLLYGPFVGVASGAVAMALTDFMLTGLYPLGFVNAPAMALLGLGGAALRGLDWEGRSRPDRWAGLAFAFAAGAFGTLLFSVSADTLTWLVVAPGSRAAWVALVLAGLAFNVVPALVNGVLFAASVRPVAGAFRRLRGGGAPARERPGPATPSRPPHAMPLQAAEPSGPTTPLALR